MRKIVLSILTLAVLAVIFIVINIEDYFRNRAIEESYNPQIVTGMSEVTFNQKIYKFEHHEYLIWAGQDISKLFEDKCTLKFVEQMGSVRYYLDQSEQRVTINQKMFTSFYAVILVDDNIIKNNCQFSNDF